MKDIRLRFIYITMAAMFIYILIGLVCIAKANADQFVLLTNATGPTTGATTKMTTYEPATWTCDVKVTGSPTTVRVKIEGNQDGSVSFDPGGMADVTLTVQQVAAGIGTFRITQTPVRYVRAKLVTLSGGTAPAIGVICTGVR